MRHYIYLYCVDGGPRRMTQTSHNVEVTPLWFWAEPVPLYLLDEHDPRY